MSQTFGLSAQGFKAKQQQDIISEIQSSLQSALGQSINLLPESVFGQIVGIFSEREALLWQLGEAVYNSQYPEGAEGASVDNILALNGLRRLPATASKTSPTISGVPGLVFYGTPGTLIPGGSLISVFGDPASQFETDTDVTIAASVDAIQRLAFTSVPTVGQFVISIEDPTEIVRTSSAIKWFSPAANQTILKSAVNPSSGQFKITVNGQNTGFLAFGASAGTIQTALQLLTGFGSVTVTGTSFATGFTITWTGVTAPLDKIATLTSNTLNQTVEVGNAVQSVINVLTGYADVTVTGSYIVGFTVNFLGTSGAQFQNTFEIVSNTLMNGTEVVNITPVVLQIGAVPQAVGSATAVATGPTFAPAGTLTVIDTPVSGWNTVNNPLDVDIGSDIEDDTDAMLRRSKLLSSQANGPLQAIVADVILVEGVTAAVGFENTKITTDGSIQLILFSNVPNLGQFVLQLGGPTGPTTAPVLFSDDAADLEAAIQALGGIYVNAVVSGDFSDGFVVFFGSSNTTEETMLVDSSNLQESGNPTDIDISGRPAKSFEIVVEGGTDETIATKIFEAKPAGIQAYGNTGPINILDTYGGAHPIYFSRPSLVPIYVSIDLFVNQATFPVDGAQQIQEQIISIGEDFNIGDDVILFGTNGLIGAFNSIAGIVDYDLTAGRTPNPVGTANVVIQPQQLAEFIQANIIININYV